jgi:hypothetical protein
MQVVIGGLLVSFQLTALEHNLAIWRTVAQLSRESCGYLADELLREPAPIAVTHVPATWDGVYFLKNSLPACILLNSKGALKQLPEISSDPIAGERVFQWNDADASFHTDHTNASRPRLHR